MRHRLVLLATLLTTACHVQVANVPTGTRAAASPKAVASQADPELVAPAGQQPKADATPAIAAGPLLSGSVIAPAGLISSDAGGLINQDGAGLIHQDGAGLRVLALGQAPLANAEVYLADAGGTPYPGMAHQRTDAHGAYHFDNVPAGYTYMVVALAKDAGGKPVKLRTLGRAGEAADIDAASTLTTVSVTSGSVQLGSVSLDHFRQTVSAIGARLLDGALPDLSDDQAILAFLTKLAADVVELKTQLGELSGQVSDLKDQVDQLQKLDQQSVKFYVHAFAKEPPGEGTPALADAYVVLATDESGLDHTPLVAKIGPDGAVSFDFTTKGHTDVDYEALIVKDPQGKLDFDEPMGAVVLPGDGAVDLQTYGPNGSDGPRCPYGFSFDAAADTHFAGTSDQGLDYYRERGGTITFNVYDDGSDDEDTDAEDDEAASDEAPVQHHRRAAADPAATS